VHGPKSVIRAPAAPGQYYLRPFIPANFVAPFLILQPSKQEQQAAATSQGMPVSDTCTCVLFAD
jgi:hypothetical protein